MDDRTRARFNAKVNRHGPIPEARLDLGGCWLWLPETGTGGYGAFYVTGVGMRRAHRVSYEMFTGPIPDGFVVDHLCGVRRCVNPDHLEAVTARENLRRAGVAAIASAALRAPIEVRFDMKTDRNGPVPDYRPDLGQCWIWKPTAAWGGYGLLFVNGKTGSIPAHRVSYERFKGPVPSGLFIDHLCRVRSCVNPDHLELVTPAENVRRGVMQEAFAASRLAITHCPQGHPYSGDNLYISTSGHTSRQCRTCARERARERRALLPKKVRQRKTHCRRGHLFAVSGYWSETQKTHVCRICTRNRLREWRAKNVPKVPPKTHCKHGHEFTEANTYRTPTGRACRACHSARTTAEYHAKRARERAARS